MRAIRVAHKTKELDTRAALLEFAYEFRTVAKRLERDERAALVATAAENRLNCIRYAIQKARMGS